MTNRKEKTNELIEKVKHSRLEIAKLDFQLTGEFIRFENRIRNELIDTLKHKMQELEYSLQELNE